MKSNTAGTGTLATVTASYWDSTEGSSAAGVGGVAKTTAELKAPTSSAGIYVDWRADKWDFGTVCDYPALKADWDGDGTATWEDFGNQYNDYDHDDDGLIEVPNLLKLNAIRYDLDGDGAPSSGNETAHAPSSPPLTSAWAAPSPTTRTTMTAWATS